MLHCLLSANPSSQRHFPGYCPPTRSAHYDNNCGRSLDYYKCVRHFKIMNSIREGIHMIKPHSSFVDVDSLRIHYLAWDSELAQNNRIEENLVVGQDNDDVPIVLLHG